MKRNENIEVPENETLSDGTPVKKTRNRKVNPNLVGVRGSVSRAVYDRLVETTEKADVDQGLILEAGLILFNQLEKGEKAQLIAAIVGERTANSF